MGQLGGAPSVEGQVLNATVNAQSMLNTPEQFQNIFLRNTSDGAQVRLGDVARVELGADNYQFNSKFNGKAAGGVAIKLANGANALDTAKQLKHAWLSCVKTILMDWQIKRLLIQPRLLSCRSKV